MRRLGAGYLAAALAAAIGASLAAAPARTQEPGRELAPEATQDAAQDSTPASSQVSRQASAQEFTPVCPGNPNALGTSRVLAIDPADYPRLGRMQYPNSLPLADKEVVITFDDGPLPLYSNQILDILASECVKVTYFLVGSMARAYPAVVRRMFLEGHTIGTHSEDHPF
ncbi:MAG TPA: polysaccharide deacetylase family protein, partial [Xanthobacteraceae bacterium]|nr:polysaccharide deacetylase family protein [Xanthobacteraceae bacterium]